MRISIVAVPLALVLAVVLLPIARSQVTPSYLPIGVASSGSSSMAWFHEPSSGRVLACQAAASAGTSLSGIQCVAAKLP